MQVTWKKKAPEFSQSKCKKQIKRTYECIYKGEDFPSYTFKNNN